MKPHTDTFANLTPKQIRCLPLLATGLSATEVGKKAKVSQIQISTWKNDPGFMSALDELRRNAMRDAEIALTGLALDGIKILRQLLNNATSEQTQLRAATYIIDKLCLSANMNLLALDNTGEVNMTLLYSALGLRQETP